MMRCSQSAFPWQLIKRSKLRRKSQVGVASILEQDSCQGPAISTSTPCLKIMQTIWRMCETPSTPPWRVVWCLGAATRTNMKCPPDRPSFSGARSTKYSSQRPTTRLSNSRAFQIDSSLLGMSGPSVRSAMKWSHCSWRDSKRSTKKSLFVYAKTRSKSTKLTLKTSGSSTPHACKNSQVQVLANTCTSLTNTKTFSQVTMGKLVNLAQAHASQPLLACMIAPLPCIDKKIERQA